MRIMFRFLWIIAFSLLVGSAMAQHTGGGLILVPSPTGATGNLTTTVFNINSSPGSDFPFMNMMLGCGSLQPSSSTFAFPQTFDANQVPSLTSNLTSTVFCVLKAPSNYTGQWIFDWGGTAGTSGAPAFELTAGTGGTITVNSCTSGGVSTSCSNCVSGSQSGVSHIQMYGTNCAVAFTPTQNEQSFTFDFLSGANFTGLANSPNPSGCSNNCQVIRMYRAADQASLNAGNFWNPDYISTLAQLRFVNLRTLGANDVNDNNNFTQSSLQAPISSFSWANGRWDPSVWVNTSNVNYTGTGGCTGTDNFCVTQVGASLVDGQVLQLQFPSASVSTTPTIQLNGGSAVTIAAMTAGVLSADITSGSMWTLIYDATLNLWLGQGGTGGSAFGITSHVPLSVLVNLANVTNSNLWYNWPPHITDASVSAMAATVNGNLNRNLKFIWEFANEVWNSAFGFQQTTWAVARGNALGFPNNNNRQYHGFYGLRLIQIANDIQSAWNSSQVVPALMAQAVNTAASTNTYRLQGADLCGTSCGNATYQSLVGVDYNAAPNRPIDRATVLGYATYYNGAILNQNGLSGTYGSWTATGTISGTTLTVSSVTGTININQGISWVSGSQQCDGVYITGGSGTTWTVNTPCSSTMTSQSITGGDLLGEQWAADNAGGTGLGSVQDGYNWLDYDVRQGTQNGTLASQTLLAYSQSGGFYTFWTGLGYNKPIYNYEGAFADLAPTTTQCTNVSFPGTAATYCGSAGTIQTMIKNYKLTTMFKQLVLDQWTQERNATGYVGGSVLSIFDLACNGCEWGMLSGDLYSSPWQSYNAAQQFNNAR